MKSKIILILVLSLNYSNSQSLRSIINKGNDLFKNDKFSESEAEYKRALEKDSTLNTGKFNLGDSFYKQGRFDDAINEFSSSMKNLNNKSEIAERFYNIGNSKLSEKKYNEAIDFYKKSLIQNPSDDDTRYNLAYAQKMLLNEQKQKNQKEQNKDQKKDKKEDEKQKENQQQENQKNKQNKQEEKKSQNSKPQISKQDAEKMLSALESKDKETQKKLKSKKGVKLGVEKDW